MDTFIGKMSSSKEDESIFPILKDKHYEKGEIVAQ